MPRNTPINIFLFVLFCLIGTDLFAQFSVTGEIRPRAEFRNGFKTLRNDSDDPAFFVEQRSRIYLDYKKEKYVLHIALQDVRIWGNHDQIYKADPALTNLYEAWARYYMSDKWSFKVGRQALDYNNARFLGDLDWAQQGRSHDALLFMFEDDEKGTKLHLGAAYNQSVFEPANLFGTTYLGVNNYKTMQFVWYNKEYNSGNLSLLFHNDGRQVAVDTSMAYRQTYGLIGNTKLGGVKLGGELYYQGGKNGADIDISAYLIALNATFSTDLTPLQIGIDYLSGTSLDEDKDRSFNPLYGTNHKFYGFMDYFYVGNNHGQAGLTAGLSDIYFHTNFKLGEKSKLRADLHYFSSASEIYESATLDNTISQYLGTELDLVYNLSLGQNASLFLGYSHMLPDESMEFLKGRGDSNLSQQWAWAMLSFKPVLFTSAEE